MKLLKNIISIILIISITGCVSVGYDEVTITTSNNDAKIIYNSNVSKGSMTVKTDGIDQIEYTVIHPDYDDINKIIKPPKKRRSEFLTRSEYSKSIATTLLLTLGGMITGTLSWGLGYIDGSEEVGPITVIGFGTLAVGLISLFYNEGSTSNWSKNYGVNMQPYSLYNNEGYHKETGFNKFGQNKEGYSINGDHFTGNYINGKKEGMGLYWSKELDTTFLGSFTDDNLNGFAIEKTKTMTTYVSFKDNIKIGYGINISNDEITLEYWGNGQLLTSEDYGAKIQSKYNLMFLGKSDGLVNGKGYAASLDGKIYVKDGVFDNGRLVSGTLVYASGLVLSGDFINDEITNGSIYYPDGRIYSGEFVNGKLSGFGSMSFSDNSTYEGNLLNGIYEGEGKYTDELGNLYQGQFKNGIFSGIGRLDYYDGGYYEGSFMYGTYNGSGKMVMGNSETFEGTFKDGLPHGQGIYKFNDKIQRAEYYEGVRIDQAYQLEKNLETYKLEQETKKKLEEQKRLEAKRFAEERQKKLEEDRKKQQSKDNVNQLLAGVAGFAVGEMLGFETSDSLKLGSELIKVSKGDTSTLEKMLLDDLKSLQMSTTGSYSGDQSIFVTKELPKQQEIISNNNLNNSISSNIAPIKENFAGSKWSNGTITLSIQGRVQGYSIWRLPLDYPHSCNINGSSISFNFTANGDETYITQNEDLSDGVLTVTSGNMAGNYRRVE